jgi:K+-sensing histidine kinase KdpD
VRTPLRRLLIAIDGRPASERTLDYVTSVLSVTAGLELELCHVIVSDDKEEGVLAAAGDRLVAAGFARDRIRASTVLRRPRVGIAQQLVDQAKQVGAETLVVGWDTCHRFTERLHRHLGEDLAARARDISSWIVRPESASARDLNMLVALDDTTESEDTAAYVGRVLAGRADIRIHLFRALEPVASSPADYADGEDAASTQELLDAAARERLKRARADAIVHLESLRQRLHDAGVAADCVTSEITDTFERPQDVPATIAKAAQAASCATVVVGCHALSWYERLLHRHVGAEILETTRDLTVWIPA